MDSWPDLVSMMSSSGEGSVLVPQIKKEEDGGSGGGSSFRACNSPANSTNIYSPTTTVMHSEMEFSESGTGHSPRSMKLYEGPCSSPGSPDRHFCSSTTQPTEGSLVRPEEGNKEEDSPKRLCLVCGDIASGFHYGVASCEACKAFFKRTIQGNIEYACPASNDCEINKRRRKACQACRFQKCLRMGMLKEGVRLDRVRGGRQKYRRSADNSYQLHALPAKKPTLEENKILLVLATCEPEVLLALPDPNLLDSDYRTISTLSDLYDRELVGIISWAKHIPGFTDLSLNDQMRLLQSTWAEILTLALAYRSLPASGRLQFASDFMLDEKQARDCGAADLFHHCMQIVERLERVAIAKEEYYLLKALVLANSDVRVDQVSSLKKLRENITSALTDCVTVLRPNNAASHMHSLLLCLPSLRQVDAVVRRFWTGVRRDGKVLMNKLFVEMLEAHLR